MPFSYAVLNNFKRKQEINRDIFQRPTTGADMPMVFQPRSVATRRTLMPKNDVHPPNSVKISPGNYSQQINFFPGTIVPFSNFSQNVDVETQLKNIAPALQRGHLHRYIPSSDSDMYESDYLVKSKELGKLPIVKAKLLFEDEKIEPRGLNKKQYIQRDIGQGLFHNHTRSDFKNIAL